MSATWPCTVKSPLPSKYQSTLGALSNPISAPASSHSLPQAWCSNFPSLPPLPFPNFLPLQQTQCSSNTISHPLLNLRLSAIWTPAPSLSSTLPCLRRPLSLIAHLQDLQATLSLTQRPTDAGHTVEVALTRSLHIEGYPVSEAAQETDPGIQRVKDPHISSDSPYPGVFIQHSYKLQQCHGV